jgi:hypothetical protein
MNEEVQTQETPKVLSRYALGARRVIGDSAVQSLYTELEAQFLTLAINHDNPIIRETNRVNLLCLQGLFQTLQQIARNELPPFLREKEDQIVKVGNGALN